MSHIQNIEKILQKINIKATETTLKKVSWHPHYPSISCLSTILDEYKVSNIVVKIQSYQLSEIAYPAIAHCHEGNGGYFVLLKNYQDNKVNYYDTDEGKICESIEEFQKKWQGVTLLIVPDEKSGEVNYSKNLKQERLQKLENYLIYGALAVIFLLSFSLSKTWVDAALWFILSLGSIISVILLINEFGTQTEFIKQICHVNKSTNCDAVLHSKASKLFGWLSWAEVGIFYFVGSLLALLFTSQSQLTHSILFLLNCLALPYIVFSIYYQGFVVQQWCLLCLSIQGVLFLEFVVFMLSNTQLKNMQLVYYQVINLILIAFLMPMAIWFVVKPHLKNSQKLLDDEKEVYFYKRNFDLFITLLGKQKSIEMDELSHEIVLGNPEGIITLTMVSNPFCKPCATAHKEIADLLNFYEEELKVIIRLVGKKPEQKQVITHLLSLVGNKKIKDVLHDWYKISDYEKWSKKYPTNLVEIENSADAWAEKIGIEFTPTFFVNGKEIVKPYTIQDLKYHIRNLVENSLINA